MKHSNEDFMLIMKSITDNTRLKILTIISEQELNATQILEQLNITQPTLSHHMNLLAKCNLIQTRKEWNMVYYSINQETAQRLIDFLKIILLSGKQ